MRKILFFIGSKLGYHNILKYGFNYLSLMYRSTGGRIIEVSKDMRYVKIKLPLKHSTKNYLGTLYGGHMYSCTDAIYAVQLLFILGKDYIVWDKEANIKYKRPGRTTLFAEFKITHSLINNIKKSIAQVGEMEIELNVNLVDTGKNIYAEIKKTIYIASNSFYEKKQKHK